MRTKSLRALQLAPAERITLFQRAAMSVPEGEEFRSLGRDLMQARREFSIQFTRNIAMAAESLDPLSRMVSRQALGMACGEKLDRALGSKVRRMRKAMDADATTVDVMSRNILRVGDITGAILESAKRVVVRKSILSIRTYCVFLERSHTDGLTPPSKRSVLESLRCVKHFDPEDAIGVGIPVRTISLCSEDRRIRGAARKALCHIRTFQSEFLLD